MVIIAVLGFAVLFINYVFVGMGWECEHLGVLVLMETRGVRTPSRWSYKQPMWMWMLETELNREYACTGSKFSSQALSHLSSSLLSDLKGVKLRKLRHLLKSGFKPRAFCSVSHVSHEHNCCQIFV